MQSYTRLEIFVGMFVVAGAVALGYLSFSLGGLRLLSQERYTVLARFASVAGLKQGDPVKISGVSVGEVLEIRLVDFRAQTVLALDGNLKLPADTIASIESNGLLGDAYISLSPGAADRDLAPGEQIARTESAISFTELISKYAFGATLDGDSKPDSNVPPQATASSAPTPAPFSNPLE